MFIEILFLILAALFFLAASVNKFEVNMLRDAIRNHRDQRGDDRCWLDDQELYSVLPETDSSNTALPPKAEFLSNCSRYHECRQNPDHKYETVVEMEARIRADERSQCLTKTILNNLPKP